MNRHPIRCITLSLVTMAGCALAEPRVEHATTALPNRLLTPSPERGARVYRVACESCHGRQGDGKGVAAYALDPQPRDFVRAVYRYRSTPTGSLPTDADLTRTVRMGLPSTAMPAFAAILSSQEVTDVVAYIKAFSQRFDEEEVDDPIDIPTPAAMNPASVERGRAAYEKAQCGKCHGAGGRGDGWANEDDMRDDLGRVVRPRDFTSGVYRCGNTKQDVYRILFTGLDGTPMPGYEDSLAPSEIYDLVNFLLSLEQPRGLMHWLTTPPRWYEPSAQRVTP